ncbi:MAG: hypothetical protein WC716_16665 [Chitinophagaceae bacterium]|jgi:hypothetical protein
MMNKILKYFGLLKTETQYITRWLPKPSAADLANVLMSPGFERFIESCKEEMSLIIQAQNTVDSRNEKVLEFRGIIYVEDRAKNFVKSQLEHAKEEKISMELTDEAQLAKEFDEAKNG